MLRIFQIESGPVDTIVSKSFGAAVDYKNLLARGLRAVDVDEVISSAVVPTPREILTAQIGNAGYCFSFCQLRHEFSHNRAARIRTNLGNNDRCFLRKYFQCPAIGEPAAPSTCRSCDRKIERGSKCEICVFIDHPHRIKKTRYAV